ncbi:MAG TPA: 3-methyl-2-oxobutanoate hydroxymethyltransferase [Bacillales bacterium]|nr:3-methyl-2-oxobutanoate hydroxymethyltransferase [Bacillales bacterium]
MKTTTVFKQMKANGESIAMITAYDFPSAKLVEAAGVDMILVGDSVGNTVLGYDSTVPVTLDDIVLHTKAVLRGARDTFVVADMPFMTYHVSEEETMKNAMRLVQEAGAHAVKVEGAAVHVVSAVEKLTAAGVPVAAHLGLTPQSVGVFGGHKVQAKKAEAARKLLEDAKALEAAGAFMLVLECVPMQIAEIVTQALVIPTIGIGAGAGTDGQVLVYHDVVGYGGDWKPKFAKRYANLSEIVHEAIGRYVTEVKAKRFPELDHSFAMDEKEVESLTGDLKR